MTRILVWIVAIGIVSSTYAAELKPGFTANVPVSAPTRMDWIFTVANQSLDKPPASFLEANYDSTQQSFDLFLPPRKNAKQPIPAIVFISAGNDAAGWKSFEPLCTKLGIAYIAVRGAGNSVPGPKRCRIILDCLDEVRRQVPLDPDRTYITGFSGGGRIACAIGLALPEYFGGIMPLCAGGELRQESWLRHRAMDRLSVAFLTGQTDFNRGEIEQWKGPLWSDIGIRAKVWVQPNLGHGIPNTSTLTEAITWMEQDRPRRAALAKTAPASRADAGKVLSSPEFAEALFQEGTQKLAAPKTVYPGLMLVKGVSDRWPDSTTGKKAKKLLLEYDAKPSRPWEADDIAEQRRELVASAKSMSNYALHGIPAGSPYVKFRPDLAKKAMELWGQVIDDSPNSEPAKLARKLLPELEALVKK